MKKQSSVQKWKLIAIGFAVLSVLILVVMLAMLAGKGWKLFAVRPLWLFFLLMMLCGVSLIVATASFMRAASMKEEIENTVVCPACQAECDKEDRFCPKCGATLEETKK